MSKYNAIIIDDELNVRRALEVMIQQNCPNIKLSGSCDSAEAGRQLLQEHKVDLIFLDIMMPKEDGFDFLASIPQDNYSIIFSTAYEEFALKAIKANAIDYLIKPINPNELKEAVAKAISYFNQRIHKNDVRKVYNESLMNLSNQIKNVGPINKITVVEQFGFRIVEVKSIRYLEADSNYTILHLSGLEKIVSCKSLGEFEKILDQPVFFRIHKSTIINMNYLKAYSTYQGNFAIIDDNTKLSVSRRRIIEFKQAVNYFSKSID